MSDIESKTGELHCTVTVTRKTTGKSETYELAGACTPGEFAAIESEARRHRVHGSAGAIAAQPAAADNFESESKE